MDKFDNKSKKIVHLGFEIGLIIKAINGLLEIVGGLLFIYFPQIIVRFVNFLVSGEVSEDPRDAIVNVMIKWTNYSTSNLKILVGVYLLIIGFAKIGFVIALYRKKLVAYVVYQWILAAFVVYQLYRYIIRQETFILVLTLLDIVVMIFIYLEYLRLKKKI